MGLFFSKKNSNTSTTQTTVNNYDQRSVIDAGGGIVGEGNTVVNETNTNVMSSDPLAFDLAGRSVAQVGDSFADLIAAGQSMVGANTDAFTKAIAGAMDLAKGAQSAQGRALESVARAGQDASAAAASAYQGAADSASGTRQITMLGIGALALVLILVAGPKLKV